MRYSLHVKSIDEIITLELMDLAQSPIEAEFMSAIRSLDSLRNRNFPTISLGGPLQVQPPRTARVESQSPASRTPTHCSTLVRSVRWRRSPPSLLPAHVASCRQPVRECSARRHSVVPPDGPIPTHHSLITSRIHCHPLAHSQSATKRTLRPAMYARWREHASSMEEEAGAISRYGRCHVS